MIAAGGTGGHIYPGIALADALRRKDPAIDVFFVGTMKGLEKALIPRAGYDVRFIDMRPFQRKIGLAPIMAGLSLLRSTAQARKLLDGASVVAGMGGYPSLPTVAAARLAGIPSLIHESGATPGLANRVAARFTRNVGLAFPEAASGFSRRVEPRVVGMPLREEIANFDRDGLRLRAREEYGIPEGTVALLVMGGSLGALRLNEVAIQLAERWRDRHDVRIILKAGNDHVDRARAELEANGGIAVATTHGFIDRIDVAYAAADLALVRAGAGTVAEIPVVGLPSILIPYPHAPGDHQTLNAQPLMKAGAGIIFADHEANADRVGPAIEDLLTDRTKLKSMAAAAVSLARPRAADDLADWLLELAA
ncbi:MAG: undecaprenyldiphospho-muramoylpentapeptide beta-N-acetylglucosaminyltransferase [Actinobacteria bacterium]|nr:undecaprenyldiphospho-muramoylpentapeptide beta-N-acetylglucosaminyltransferase [Actinomycetota bacterium]